MEDASGEDLDWFWRGWFYGIDPVDISLDSVKAFQIDPTATPKRMGGGGGFGPRLNANGERGLDKPSVPSFDDISKVRNRQDKNIHFLTDADTTLRDFYWNYDRGYEPFDSIYKYKPAPMTFDSLDEASKQKYAGKYLYEVSFTNKGGLVMPIIVEWTFTDGTKEVDRIPAQIWRKDEKHVTKVFLKDKEVASVLLDPMRETADIDETNNSWPKIDAPSKLAIFKARQAARGVSSGLNPMQKAAQK
jgi:hypothetical protein